MLTAWKNAVKDESPSMRREWIEMADRGAGNTTVEVSLHAEGVD